MSQVGELGPKLGEAMRKFFRLLLPLRATLRFPRDAWFLYHLLSKKARENRENRFALVDLSRSVYINLKRRIDRRSQVEAEFSRIDRLEVRRFEAIENELGLLGAGQSHLAILRSALRENCGPILVFEDDIQFHCDSGEFWATLNEFLQDHRLDVLVLSPSFYGWPWPISERLAIGNNIRTAAAYLVKPSALEPLIARFESSVAALTTTRNERKFAYDALWEYEQKRTLLFAVPRKRLITQRPSFSDLQRRHVSY